MKSLFPQVTTFCQLSLFYIFVCCDYLVSTNSYVYVGMCVGIRSHRHDADSRKIGRFNRMSPTCRDDISDMSATDKNVCRLRGAADRHICRHCQPSCSPTSDQGGWGFFCPHSLWACGVLSSPRRLTGVAPSEIVCPRRVHLRRLPGSRRWGSCGRGIRLLFPPRPSGLS